MRCIGDRSAGLRLIRPLRLSLGHEVWMARLGGRLVVARRLPAYEQKHCRPPPPDERTLEELNHPNIQRYVASFMDVNDDMFLVFMWYAGNTLAELAGEPATGLGAGTVSNVMTSGAMALRWMHERSPVSPRLHGDISPGNVLVENHGRVRLLDALALVPGEYATGRGVVFGTLPYLSVEVLEGLPPREPSDVFSLGLTCLYAATGRLPWAGADRPSSALKLMKSTLPVSLVSKVRALEPRHRKLLSAMVDLDPSARPTADEICRW